MPVEGRGQNPLPGISNQTIQERGFDYLSPVVELKSETL
jgi:hypothetical protein